MPTDASKVETGVPGLDEILHGGLPQGRFYLVRGAAGTGKTTLAIQFLLEGVKRGEPVVYVSLSQTEDELRQIAASHGWSLDGVNIQSLSTSDQAPDMSDQTIFQSADLRLDRTRDAVQAVIDDIRPQRVVYDSLLEIRLLAEDMVRFRREVLGFKSYLSDQRITTLLIDTEHDNTDRAEDQLENIAHGIIRLEKLLPSYGTAQRRVEIKKLRGSPIRDGYHDASIRSGAGLTVYPRVVPNIQPDESLGDLIKSNIDTLDDMLGGGLEEGTTTLLIGQSGTGKSTLASLYADAALERGEHVAMFLFEERVETFFRRSEGLGIKLREHHKANRLLLFDFNPAEVSPGEFSQIVLQTLEDNQVRVIMIDSLTGYLGALPESKQAITQMHTLLKYAARKGVLSLLTVAQHGLLGDGQHTDLDVSYLGDAVLLLRMYEVPNEVKRTIAAVKKRHGPHDLAVNEFQIGPEGVSIQTRRTAPDPASETPG